MVTIPKALAVPRRRAAIRACWGACWGLASAGPAHGLFRYPPGALGHAATMGAGEAAGTGAPAPQANPAAPAAPGWGFALGYCRPFGLDGASLGQAGIQAAGREWAGAFGWTELRISDLYREQAFALQLSHAFPAGFRMGAEAGGLRVELPGQPAAVLAGDAIGFTWKPGGRFAAGAYARDFLASHAWPALDRAYGLGLALGPERGLRLLADWRKGDGGPGRYRFGPVWRLGPGLEVAAGWISRPVQWSLGFQAALGVWAWRQAAQTHPALGNTFFYGLQGAFPPDRARAADGAGASNPGFRPP